MLNIFMELHDNGGCGYYRAELPASLCKSADWSITLKGSLASEDIDAHDVFIFHRLPSAAQLFTIENLKKAEKKVVWELDDDFWNLPPWQVPLAAEDEFDLECALDLADMVLVSTPALSSVVAGHVAPSKIRIVPNLISLNDFFPVADKEETIRVLWAGSGFHYGDIQQLAAPINALIDKYEDRVIFLFLGDIPEGLCCYRRIAASRDLLGQAVPERRNVGLIYPVGFNRYYSVLEEIKPHICLAPLLDVPFNRSKSNLKWLEYSMVGGCTVASDVEPYRSIRHCQDGFLVGPSDWFDMLCHLIENPVKVSRVACAARERVGLEYSWQGSGADQWGRVFEEFFR